MTFLSATDILQIDDSVFETVEVPEWNGTVRINGLTAYQRDKFEASVTVSRGKSFEINSINIRAKLLAWTLADKDGNLLFTEKDVKALSAKSGLVMNRLFGIARELSGMTEGDVEELVGNSEGDQDDS